MTYDFDAKLVALLKEHRTLTQEQVDEMEAARSADRVAARSFYNAHSHHTESQSGTYPHTAA